MHFIFDMLVISFLFGCGRVPTPPVDPVPTEKTFKIDGRTVTIAGEILSDSLRADDLKKHFEIAVDLADKQ